MTKFPRILAAWRQIELDQWELGDALIEECGEPAALAARRPGTNTGEYAKLEEAAVFLEKYGFDHGVGYLAKLRQTAFDFKVEDRKKNLSWSTHNEAGTPDTLKKIIAKIGDEKPTRDMVRDTRRELEGRIAPPLIDRDVNDYRRESPAIVGLDLVDQVSKIRKQLVSIVRELGDNIDYIGEESLACINKDLIAIAEIARKTAQIKPTGLMVVGGRK